MGGILIDIVLPLIVAPLIVALILWVVHEARKKYRKYKAEKKKAEEIIPTPIEQPQFIYNETETITPAMKACGYGEVPKIL